MNVLSVGNEIKLKVENLSKKGEGVSLIDEKVFFIPLTVPGDIVRVKINSIKNNLVYTKLLEIIKPSKKRVLPLCNHFSKCGGCDLQHVEYLEQIKQKEHLLKLAFKKQNIKILKPKIFPAKKQFGYRCKVRFSGNGFSAKNSNKIVKIEKCPVLDERLQTVFSETRFKGECFGVDELTNKITKKDAHYFVDDLILEYSPDSFVQSNFEMNKKLVKYVVNQVKSKDVLELYCGNGNFTLSLLKKLKNVVAVEGNPFSFELLTRNLDLNRLKAITINKDVRQYLRKRNLQFDCVVLDPPRSGVEKNVERLAEITYNVVYISCNVDALVKDTKILIENGFQIVSVAMFDMFPQTRHFETVLVLKKTN